MQIGCSIHSAQIGRYRDELFRLPVIELEDCLHPGFLDHLREELPSVRESLSGFEGQIVVSGPFIDLNMGSPERLNVDITQIRFEQAYEFAHALGAVEIVFLSSFLPIINLSSYEEDWIARSIAFWKSYVAAASDMVISLGNTFEYFPDYLLRIAQAVDQPNFRLTTDLGHCLVHSRVTMEEWARRVQEDNSTVYIHSNNGLVDSHDEPSTGLLGEKDYLTPVGRHLSHCRMIAKMNNKDSISESIRWIQARLAS